MFCCGAVIAARYRGRLTPTHFSWWRRRGDSRATTPLEGWWGQWEPGCWHDKKEVVYDPIRELSTLYGPDDGPGRVTYRERGRERERERERD